MKNRVKIVKKTSTIEDRVNVDKNRYNRESPNKREPVSVNNTATDLGLSISIAATAANATAGATVTTRYHDRHGR